MNYGINLKNLRERDGKTIIYMANILGVSDSLYSRYEKEKQTIPLKHLITLCDYFNVSLDFIFNFTRFKNYSNYQKNYNNELMVQRLKSFRKENNLTQVKLTNFLNIDQPTWSIYEKGKSLLGLPFLYMICKKYNISADYLLGKINEPKYINMN